MSFLSQTWQEDVSEGQPEEMGDLSHGVSTDGRVLPPPAGYEDGDGEVYVRVDESPERAPPRLDSDEDFPLVGASSPRPRRISVARRPGPKCKTRGTKTRWTAFDPANPPSQSRSPSPARSEKAGEQSTLQRAPAVKRKTRCNTEAAMEVDVYSSSSESVAPPPPEKRGRGRPGSTGEFVGLRKAKSAVVEKEQEYLRLLAERELLESWTEPSVTRSRSARLNRTSSLPDVSAPSSGAGDGVLATLSKPSEEMTSEELMGQLRLAVGAVERITRLKKGNKDTSIGVLKKVAKVMGAAGLELSRRTQTEETNRAAEENARLTRELEEARRALVEGNARHKREMEKLREELREVRGRVAELSLRPSAHPSQPPPPSPLSGKPEFPAPPPCRAETFERAGELPSTQSSRPTTGVAAAKTTEADEDLEVSIFNRLAVLLTARLDAFEARLPPERSFRPALGVKAGGSKEVRAPPNVHQRPEARRDGSQWKKSSCDPRPAQPVPAPRDGKKAPPMPVAEPKQQQQQRLVKGQAQKAPQAPQTAAETWAVMASRGKRGKAAKGGTAVSGLPPAKPATPTAASGEGEKKAGGGRAAARPNPPPAPPVPRPRKIRPPKRAAILLTMAPVEGDAAMEATGPDGAPTARRGLGDVMAGVCNEIKLSDFGVASLRPKRAATGGMLYEVPGQDGGQKADKLAEALRALLGPKGVKVSRPVKREELRVTGLDDAATEEGVAEAAATAGGCAAGELKIGKINRSPRGGLRSVWIQCPAVAARKIMNNGRLQVGWVAAKVEALQARPLQCYKCLGSGHTRASCKSKVDRSDSCYRCGQQGHTAAGCSAELKCPYCSGHNLPAEHRYGAKTCAVSKSLGRGSKKVSTVAQKKGASAEKTQPPTHTASFVEGVVEKKKKKKKKAGKKKAQPPASHTPGGEKASGKKGTADGVPDQPPSPTPSTPAGVEESKDWSRLEEAMDTAT